MAGWIEKPNGKGWWWVRQGRGFRPQVVEVYPDPEGRLRASGGPFAYSPVCDELAGWEWRLVSLPNDESPAYGGKAQEGVDLELEIDEEYLGDDVVAFDVDDADALRRLVNRTKLPPNNPRGVEEWKLWQDAGGEVCCEVVVYGGGVHGDFGGPTVAGAIKDALASVDYDASLGEPDGK